MSPEADRRMPVPERPGPGAIARARRRLDALWQRGRDFLGCNLAVMGGAMTWVSERNLVAAISNATARIPARGEGRAADPTHKPGQRTPSPKLAASTVGIGIPTSSM